MEELIKYTRQNGKKVVSAKELHILLEVKSKFADWIKNRISTYGFIENQEFTTVSKNLESGGKEIDYAITLDMAKELCMVERNDQGKKARKYFIEIEKKARPDFTPITSFEAHGKKEVQKLNSKEVNTLKYEQGGREKIIAYNTKNCELHTGKTPKQILKFYGNRKDLNKTILKNAKEVLRVVDPVTACAMSLTDNMVKLGGNHEKAAEISNVHGREVFKFMIENGIIPGELGQSKMAM